MLYRSVIDDSRIIINLASKEYSKCIEKYLTSQDRYITIVFCELSGDKLEKKVPPPKGGLGKGDKFKRKKKKKNGGRLKNLTDSDIRLGLIYLQIQNMYLNAK